MRQPRMDPEVRRQQILEEATRLIGLQGYNGLTVHDLARRCGLTNGGLLYYFGSKEQLLVAILEERDRHEAAIIHADLEVTRATSGAAHYARGTVLQIFRAIVARSVAQPELLRFHTVLQSEALNHEHPAHAFFLRRDAMVLCEFAKVLAGHVDAPARAARQVFALISGINQQWLRADMEFDLMAEFDAAIALVLPWAKTISQTGCAVVAN
jgi:AcrR family transcriptional regulator